MFYRRKIIFLNRSKNEVCRSFNRTTLECSFFSSSGSSSINDIRALEDNYWHHLPDTSNKPNSLIHMISRDHMCPEYYHHPMRTAIEIISTSKNLIYMSTCTHKHTQMEIAVFNANNADDEEMKLGQSASEQHSTYCFN